MLTTNKVGDRVQLIFTDDPYTELRSGDTGTVNFIDDEGTVFIKWDCGTTSLGLNTKFGDRWATITQ